MRTMKCLSRRGYTHVLGNETPPLTTQFYAHWHFPPLTPVFEEITFYLMTTHSRYLKMYYSTSAFNLHPNVLQSQNYWFSFPFFRMFGLTLCTPRNVYH